MLIGLFSCMSVYAPLVCHRGQKRVSGPLELELQSVVGGGACGWWDPKSSECFRAISLSPILTELEVANKKPSSTWVKDQPGPLTPGPLCSFKQYKMYIQAYRRKWWARSESPVPPGTQWLWYEWSQLRDEDRNVQKWNHSADTKQIITVCTDMISY